MKPRRYEVIRRYITEDSHFVIAKSKQDALEKWAEVDPVSEIIKNLKLRVRVDRTHREVE